MQETPVWFLDWEVHWRMDRLPTPVFLGFPCGSSGKESSCNAGDLGLISGLGRSPGEGKGYPLQYSGLENSMDCIVHGVSCKESDTTEQLSLHFIMKLVHWDTYFEYLNSINENAMLCHRMLSIMLFQCRKKVRILFSKYLWDFMITLSSYLW